MEDQTKMPSSGQAPIPTGPVLELQGTTGPVTVIETLYVSRPGRLPITRVGHFDKATGMPVGWMFDGVPNPGDIDGLKIADADTPLMAGWTIPELHVVFNHRN